MNDPPLVVKKGQLYRVARTVFTNGVADEKSVTGYIEFRADGDRWGVLIDQPGDTTIYLPPGSYGRIQEHDPKRRNGGPP